MAGTVIKCARCGGTGKIPHPLGGPPQTCPVCHGTGSNRV
jgi:DnaJ-class molecular chaperone